MKFAKKYRVVGLTEGGSPDGERNPFENPNVRRARDEYRELKEEAGNQTDNLYTHEMNRLRRLSSYRDAVNRALSEARYGNLLPTPPFDDPVHDRVNAVTVRARVPMANAPRRRRLPPAPPTEPDEDIPYEDIRRMFPEQNYQQTKRRIPRIRPPVPRTPVQTRLRAKDRTEQAWRKAVERLSSPRGVTAGVKKRKAKNKWNAFP